MVIKADLDFKDRIDFFGWFGLLFLFKTIELRNVLSSGQKKKSNSVNLPGILGSKEIRKYKPEVYITVKSTMY